MENLPEPIQLREIDKQSFIKRASGNDT